MDTGKLELKPVENKEDIASVVSFLNTVLSHKISDELWEWEFNTFPNDIVITLIKDKDETVGTQFMMPVTINIRGTEVLSGKCENSFFSNKYRGMGLFQKLFSFAEDLSLKKSHGLLWAFTGAIKVYEKTLGFTALPDIMYNFSMPVGKPGMGIVRTNNPGMMKACLKYSYYFLKYFAFKFKCKSFANEINYTGLLHNYEVRDALRSYEDMDILYSSLRSNHGDFVHIKIDKPFLEWRITNNFNLKYVTKYFYKKGGLVGYYIFSVNQASAHLSDFTPLNEESSKFMMCHLLKEISVLKISTLTYFGNIANELNQNTFNLLAKFGGGTYVSKEMPFVYKTIPEHNTNDPFLSLSKNWYLNGLWTEGLAY